jgi:hypothetical protein
VSINAAKFASGGKWKPTWIPKYFVPLPFGIHFNPLVSPHSQLLSLRLAQMATNLLQLTLAPDARQKVLRTSDPMLGVSQHVTKNIGGKDE